jgi:Zn-dependent peptidase ImmA (M78 family)
MKIPSKVKIGTVEYKIVEKDIEKIDTLNVGKTLDNKDYATGECNLVYGEISVIDKLKTDIKLHTVMHEIAHAFIRQYGIETRNEENTCNFISAVVLQFINDNIEEIKWKE